jgi:hypothetical protein
VEWPFACHLVFYVLAFYYDLCRFRVLFLLQKLQNRLMIGYATRGPASHL